MQSIGTLSGGEQAKVKICLLTLTPCNFIIMDEPTNHLDIQAKQALRIALGIFSQELFDKYHILTSRGIQERYLRAVAKRKGIEVKKEYSLVKVAQNAVNDGRNPVNDVNNPVNDAKKRKEKKRINNSAPAPASPDPPEDDDEWEDPEESLRKWEAWKAKREKNDES